MRFALARDCGDLCPYDGGQSCGVVRERETIRATEHSRTPPPPCNVRGLWCGLLTTSAHLYLLLLLTLGGLMSS